MLLSKSDYMLFLRHPAWLWLKKHNRSKLPIVDENTQATFDAGHEFESYAEKLLPQGIKLGFSSFDEYVSMPSRTMQAIEEGNKTIFQGRFENKELTFICDAINFIDEKTGDLYEIKSSTKVKDDHIYDLAFQMVVLESLGYEVRDIYVLHVNSEYVRKGDINPQEFVATTKVTDEVKEKRGETKIYIQKALEVAKSSTMPNPSPSLAKLGSFKEWLVVYRNLVPVEKDSIYDLCLNNSEIVGKLEAMGIKKLSDIPSDFPLNKKQQLQVNAVKQNRVLAAPERIKENLNSFTFPLYFLDYETLSSIVPYFDGLTPYEQLPFQYSLHILEAPGEELKHVSYLHKDNTNPAEELCNALKTHIGTTGSIITWNMSFEKGCNSLLGELLPHHKDFFEDVNSRIVDLMIPFSNGMYVDKNFMGSASIKKVLPVLVPDLSYLELNIHEGGSAQRLWMEAILYGKRDGEKEQILADLLEYCGLDTLAMVEIYRYLLNYLQRSEEIQEITVETEPTPISEPTFLFEEENF